MSAVAINNSATSDPSIESLEKEIQSIFQSSSPPSSNALVDKHLQSSIEPTHLNPEVLITTMTTTTRQVQYSTGFPMHNQYNNGGTRLGRDRGDSITSDGYYSRNNSPIISYAKSDDGTQTEVEKESVHIQVPYLTSEAVQTEPLTSELETVPLRVEAANKVHPEQDRRRRKQFVDYVCDVLVFLQDCCTCNGVGGVL